MSNPRHPQRRDALNCWQVLGLPPDSDRAAIKKAYAARLKHTRPDDDAQAYQALRQAYETALQWADTAPPARSATRTGTGTAANPCADSGDNTLADPAARAFTAPSTAPSADTAADTATDTATATPSAQPAAQPPSAPAAPLPPAPDKLARQLHAALQASTDEASSLRAAWQRTAQALNAMPLHWQPWASHDFAQLLLRAHARMPDWLQLALLQRFDWLNDFRALQGLTPVQQQALHNLLAPLQERHQRDSLLNNPAFEAAYPQLCALAQLSRRSPWRTWLYALLSGSALLGQWQRAIHASPQAWRALAADDTDLSRPIINTTVVRMTLLWTLGYVLLAAHDIHRKGGDLLQWALMLPAWLVGWVLLGGGIALYAQRLVQRLHALRDRLGHGLQARFAFLRHWPARAISLGCLWVAAALACLLQAWLHGVLPSPFLHADLRDLLLPATFALALLGLALTPPLPTPAGLPPPFFALPLVLWLLCLMLLAPWLHENLPEAWLPSLLAATAWWLSCASLSASPAIHTWLRTRRPRAWQEALRWALCLGPAWPWTLLQLGWHYSFWPPLFIVGSAWLLAWLAQLPHALLLPLTWLSTALWLAAQHVGLHLARRLATPPPQE